MSRSSFLTLISACALFCRSASGADVVMPQYDLARTSSNPLEVLLSTANVNQQRFGKLYTRALDGRLYAQPLLMRGVRIAGHGTPNIIFVATAHNTVCAFDADDGSVTSPYWAVNLGPADSTPSMLTSPNSEPELGIIGTPVIVPARRALYVVASTREAGHRVYRLHALDLSTGAEKFGGPRIISGQVAGNAPDSVGGVVTFNADFHLHRASLAVANDSVYVAMAGSRDTLPFHGWLFGYDTATLNPTGVVCITPAGYQGGIWQGNRAPVVDSAGNLFFETGNGDFDGNSNFSNSVLRYSTTGQSLQRADWFTPSNWQALSNYDLDLASAGPLQIPGTGFLVAGGKQGIVYFFDSNSLGHLQLDGSPTAGQFQATPPCSFPLDGCRPIHYMAFWNRTLFLWAAGDVPRSWSFSQNQFTAAATGSRVADYPGGYLAVSSYLTTPRSGVLWALTGHESSGLGTLHAFDASNLSVELWNSDQNPGRDSLGDFAKFLAPVVANGKVYAGNFSNQLVVYGLLNGPVPGDANADSVVDCRDMALVKASYGKTSTQPGFDLRADLVPDGVINIRDLSFVTQRVAPGLTCH
jgi:hypothetical protein